MCAGFAEGPLLFPPTFKHVAGEGPRTQAKQAADGADGACGVGLRSYEAVKMRVPSWTDRVLWRSWPALSAQLQVRAALRHRLDLAMTAPTSPDP